MSTFPFTYVYKPSMKNLKAIVTKKKSSTGKPLKTFNEIVQIVIDNFEGGYYHPNMLNDSRGARWSQATKDIFSGKAAGFSPSGETMFGLDRLNGKQETTKAGREFWKLVDDAGAKKNWNYNYLGGSIAPQLKIKTAEIMKPLYDSLALKFFSDKTKQLVESDNRLLINFVYAVWNGSGFFKRWAKALNEATANGENNTDELVKIAMNSRRKETASTIKKSADKMETLFKTV